MKRTLVVLVTMIAVLLTVAPPAHAAIGTFGYYISPTWHAIDDPADGVCHSLIGSAAVVRNHTNTAATLYEDFHCTPTSLIGAAHAGAEVSLADVFPSVTGVASVKFGVL